MAAIDEWRQATGFAQDAQEAELVRTTMDSARTELGITAFERAWQTGRLLSLDDAMSVALVALPAPTNMPDPPAALTST